VGDQYLGIQDLIGFTALGLFLLGILVAIVLELFEEPRP
jgi:hypothetical protein